MDACRTSNPSPLPCRDRNVGVYRYLLGDFAPFIYRTDDFGKTWTRLTDGKNGIARDEPTRVVREDPRRAGLLYAGTEFGIYISFDEGAHWQSFQLNLPVTPVTDIKVAHDDLILSTQGRCFWILDNLTPAAPVERRAWRIRQRTSLLRARRSGRRRAEAGAAGFNIRSRERPSTTTSPQPPAGDISLEILDGSGKPVKKFTSAGGGEEPAFAADADDDESGFRFRGGPSRLDKTPGMHRFTWDLRYPGPWQSAARPEAANGPTAVPGRYGAKLTVGSWTGTQQFTVIEDPRVTKAGVTLSDLQGQFEHNLRVRDLVSDVNQAVVRLRAAMSAGRGDQTKLKELASHLITPGIRYSKPELQTHITYLYSVTTATDQRVGKDVVERYGILRKELDQRIAELNRIIGHE